MEPVAASTGSQRAKSKPKPKPVITSLEDLLNLSYESNARLLELSKDSLKKLPVTDEGLEAQRERVCCTDR